VNPARALNSPDLVSCEPNNLIQFLKAHGRNADADCVSQAITRLGGFRIPSGVDFLVDLLDFRRRDSPGEKLHLFDPHNKFPSVPALKFSGGSGIVTERRRKPRGLKGWHSCELDCAEAE
jgi:hypothetical protein